MRTNELKARLAAGETVYGCFSSYPEPALVELIALSGFDFAVFDGEHGTLEPRDVENLTRAAESRGMTSIARVPTNDAAAILRFLDTGVQGIHVPWVNTVEGVEQAVGSAKYGPRGVRGLAGSRASDWGHTGTLAEHTQRANEETLVVIHIETEEAVDAAPDYCKVDGVDVLFIGPTDLSHSLGHPGELEHPKVAAALERAAEAVLAGGKILGIYAGSPSVAVTWHERGARYMTTGIDGFIKAGLAGYIDNVPR